MAEDYELPVWGVRPNWAEPVVETLEWLTDVLVSKSGAEQRPSYRLSPRRMVEARYNPYQNERTFVDLALQRLGRSDWMTPLWFDAARLTSAAAVTTTRLNFVTAFHEFAVGGMAYLVGADVFSGEAVRISAIDEDGIDLAAPLAKAWRAGATIHPMRRGRFESTSGANLTSRLAETNLRFEIDTGNDLSDEGTWATTHGDYPVLTETPDWSDQIDIDLSWLSEDFDSLVGRKYVSNSTGRAFRQQKHAFLLVGAQEQFEFRQMLYRLRGRQKGIWLPTFADDFTVASTAAPGATTVDIQVVGLSYVGGPAEGRKHLYLPGGAIVEMESSVLLAGGAIERITLTAGLGAGLAAGSKLSFVETCRLAQDSVEIEHLGDSEGAARSALSFAAFADRRVATTAAQPAPTATMTTSNCGSPEEDNECAQVFEGWYYDVRWEVERTDGGAHNGTANFFGPSGYLGGSGQYELFEPPYWIIGNVCTEYHLSPGHGGVGIGTWSSTIDAFALGGNSTDGPFLIYRLYWKHWTQESYNLVYESAPTRATGAINRTFEVNIAP